MSGETSMAGETTPVAADPPEPVDSATVPPQEKAEQDPGNAPGGGQPDSRDGRIAELEAELEALRSENDSLRGQYMRIAADFDNFRKRQSRDHEDLKLQITSTTLGEILPVVDNFDRARQQLTPQDEEAQTIHRSYQGLYRQLVEVFKQLGVSPMRVEGEPFDPNLHEAVMREESEHHPEDVVIEELQRGYHINGKVLRHALVKVSMGPGPAQPASAEGPPEDPGDEGAG